MRASVNSGFSAYGKGGRSGNDKRDTSHREMVYSCGSRWNSIGRHDRVPSVRGIRIAIQRLVQSISIIRDTAQAVRVLDQQLDEGLAVTNGAVSGPVFQPRPYLIGTY